MILDELVSNLKTYEMNMYDLEKEKVSKEKSLALKAYDSEESDLNEEQVAFLAKILKYFSRKERDITKKKKVVRNYPMIYPKLAAISVIRLIT